jgi:hypothetical protein
MALVQMDMFRYPGKLWARQTCGANPPSTLAGSAQLAAIAASPLLKASKYRRRWPTSQIPART